MPAPDVAGALPPLDPADETPTIISMNRPRATSADVADGLRGKKLAHFELLEPIGVGGMAAVIRANDLQLGRVVALKILPPEMAADPENISRFKQEARAAAKLDHENVARVYFCGEDQGLHFIAFEYVEGTDLRTMMANGGPLAPATAVKYMLQVAAGLAHAASRGVVHRDIKPSNLVITPEGRAKIVDMGLARSADGGVTQSGVTLGTFDYISPEQAIEPRNADVRSDIYSLGCTFYHLLTGQPPVPEGTAAKKLHHHQQVPPVDPRELNPAIPDELVTVLGKMMAKEARDRYQRPEQLIQHLLIIANRMQLPADASSQETMLFVDAPMPQPARFSPALAAVVAVAAVALLAVVLGMGGGDPRPLPGLPASRSESGMVAANGRPNPPLAAVQEKPIIDRTPRPAANEQELARLLEQKAEVIELTGDEYDIAALTRGDATRPLIITSSVRIVGKQRGGRRPLLRWKVEPAPGRDADTPLALLNIAAATGTQVRVDGVEFDVQAAGSEAPVYAIAADGITRLTLSDCKFTHAGRAGGSVRFVAPFAPSADVDLLGCHFAQGVCAVDVAGRAAIHARQCSFGPHESVFVFGEKGVPATPSPADRLLAELERCTVMTKGESTVFHAGRSVSGTIRAGDCLFGRADDHGEVVLVREEETRDRDSGALRFVAPDTARNVYYGVTCWSTPTRQAAMPADCKKQKLAFLDPAAEFEPGGAPPWQKPQPLDVADPKEAFALRTDRPELRTRSDAARMVGVDAGAFGDPYGKLASLAEVTPEAANVVVVDPLDTTNRHFKSFSAAIQGRTGDLTVLIHHKGPIEIEPVVLAELNLRLTVRPDEGCRPVITLKTDVDAEEPAIFSLHNGSISFKDLRFLLQPAANDDSKWVSVVKVTGAGAASFEDCSVTLRNPDASDDTQPVLVTLKGSESGAGDKLPRVRLSNCFIRGRGHVIAVPRSRPFELEAENVLAVLRGSFTTITGQQKDAPLSVRSQLTFKRVTTYLTDAFLELHAADGKAAGLVVSNVKCEDCLLVAAADRPIVFAERLDRDTLTKALLTWEGAKNVYGNFQKYLEAKPGGTVMIMQTDWTATDWRNFSHEGDNATATVKFVDTPNNDAGYTTAVPNQFRPKLTDMQRMDVMTRVGADVDGLQKLIE
jgi:hypothetical protein